MEIITVFENTWLNWITSKLNHIMYTYNYKEYSVNGYGSKKLDEFRLVHKI